MIKIDNIYKSFGEIEVLKGISASFQPGEVSMLIGASGSGKSTLAKCMVGLHAVNQGAVYYNGLSFFEASKQEKKNILQQIGFMFQGSALFDSMTVEDNVAFPLKMFTNNSSSEIKKRVDYCLDRVNLAGKNKLLPSELSGGMKKRVGIARAISMEPKYLFCDEPNSGLDPLTGILIDQLIKELTKELNVVTIVISHDMNSVMEIGDYILFLYKGLKEWDGNNKQILSAQKKELVDFVYASEYMKKIKDVISKSSV